MISLSSLTVKRPDKSDVMDLLPAVVVLAVWLFLTDRSMRSNKTMLIPALFGVAAWVALKGIRYVPR